MIFYFSGTGNSRWVAEKIAEETEDVTFDITWKKTIDISEQERQIGFVFPIYAWGIPKPMVEFVKKMDKKKIFTYAVCTCGQDAGTALKKFSQIYHLESAYSLTMPNNYIIGSDLEAHETMLKKLQDAENEIHKICSEIVKRKKVYHVSEGRFAGFKTEIIHRGFQKFARDTKGFWVTDQCDGCGRCEKNCPASAIVIREEKPVWYGNCYQCMRCIHGCPQIAIQFGKKTQGRGRYSIQKLLTELNSDK